MAKKVGITEAENRFITHLFLNRQDFTNGKERRALHRHFDGARTACVSRGRDLAAHVAPDADVCNRLERLARSIRQRTGWEVIEALGRRLTMGAHLSCTRHGHTAVQGGVRTKGNGGNSSRPSAACHVPIAGGIVVTQIRIDTKV